VTNILGELGNLASQGPDMLLQAMATLIDMVGEGTEWTGEQIDKLGELEGKLADKIRSLKGE
jgi:hypothetical protein